MFVKYIMCEVCDNTQIIRILCKNCCGSGYLDEYGCVHCGGYGKGNYSCSGFGYIEITCKLCEMIENLNNISINTYTCDT